MNKIKLFFTYFLLSIIFFILFKYNYIISNSVIEASNIWLTKVFPFLFIMIIINNIIIETNILNPFFKMMSPLFNKIFHTSGEALQVFVLAIFSGTPTSAFIIREFLDKKMISLNDANKLISFTFFTNPLFLYNILNVSFNKIITIKIIIVHYLSNIFIGLLFRKESNNLNTFSNKFLSQNKNWYLIIPNAIKVSINTLLMILGTITFYTIITNLLSEILKLNNLFMILVKGLFEITNALNTLNTYSTISIIKEIIALSIISFGGLSIHTQVLSLINDTKIKYREFFKGRIFHVLITTSLYLIIAILSSI